MASSGLQAIITNEGELHEERLPDKHKFQYGTSAINAAE